MSPEQLETLFSSNRELLHVDSLLWRSLRSAILATAWLLVC